MTIAPGLTDDQVRAYVYEYELLPQGSKQAWLEDKNFSGTRLRKWRDTVFDGDLDRGLIPREGHPMSSANARRYLAKQHQDHQAENEQLRARIRELEEVNDALGKAIGLLHQNNEQEPEAPETTEPDSS